MRRRLRWAALGAAACAAAVLLAVLLTNEEPEAPVGAKLVVPQGQDSELAVPKPPASSVSVLPPLEPISTTPSTSAPASPPSTAPTPRPPSSPPAAPKTPPKPVGVDFQAENARIINGSIESNHAGFTGSGFVDYDNQVGSSVEWTVTALATTSADVVFRYANGSSEARPMSVTVNGIQVATVNFPVTNGWDDWRTVTVRVNLLAGTSRIKATATTQNGGPNVDKITIV